MSVGASHTARKLGDLDSRLVEQPFRYFISKHKRVFCFGVLSLAFTNILDALPPLLVGRAIDQIARNEGINAIVLTCVKLAAVIACLALFRYLWRIHWGRFSHTAATEVRDALYEKFLTLGPGFLQKRTIGDFMSIMANDVNVFRMAIGPGLLILFDIGIILCVVPPLMLSLSIEWTWKTMILMPVVPFVVYRILKIIGKTYGQTQKIYGELSELATEIASGIRVIKSYGQEDNQTQIYNRQSRAYEDSMNKVARVDSYFSPTLEVAVATGCVVLLMIGAPQVMQGAVSLGAFFAFYQYVQRMVWPMEGLGIALSHIQQGRASYARIAEVLRQPTDIPDHGTKELQHFESLSFDNVTFAYTGDEPVLRDFSFELRAGEILGITGVTGSGKSTLVDLICRHFTPQQGHIRMNGLELEQIKRANLRQLMSVVPQETFVFSRKVSENIALGLDIWEQHEVQQVAELVQMHDEISSLPQVYDTYLGERGVNLSGGQRQRLSLARALIRKAPLIIFDDSLSAVDARTEEAILANLRHNLRGAEQSARKAALVISHRIGSLKWADRILVVNQGRIEAIGTHAQLLNQSPTYSYLHELQSKRRTHVEVL